MCTSLKKQSYKTLPQPSVWGIRIKAVSYTGFTLTACGPRGGCFNVKRDEVLVLQTEMAMIGNTGSMKEDIYGFIGFDKSATFLFDKPFNPAFSHW
jgi:hypothetical protein